MMVAAGSFSGRASSLGSAVRPSSSGRESRLGGAVRPSSSAGRAVRPGVNVSAALIEEAIAMCRGAKGRSSGSKAAEPPLETSPRAGAHLLSRPHCPTPEQTNHWLHGLDGGAPDVQVGDGDAGRRDGSKERHRGVGVESAADQIKFSPASSRSASSTSPRNVGLVRPRSPTPTKMLAWEESGQGTGHCRNDSTGSSPDNGRGDHTDGLIAQLISACQMNEIDKAFDFYHKLNKMRVPLFEGVYKMIIECCMRTQHLGHAMQFYDTLKSSGQRVSSRLVMVLMEACAKEQHGDKVHAIWNDWCPPNERMTTIHGEVLLIAVSALIRTMSPDLACDILSAAMERSGDRLAACFSDSEVELEDLLVQNETAAEDAQSDGALLEEMAERFLELHNLLDDLRMQSLSGSPGNTRCSRGEELLVMEDVDLDLELAAI